MFMRRQRAAAELIVDSLERLSDARVQYTAEVERALHAVMNAPGGAAGRAQEAARQVGPALATLREELLAQNSSMMAAVAELSSNWAEHEALWDDLEAKDLATVIDARESWTALREAASE